MTPVALPPKNCTRGTVLRWCRVPGLVLAEVGYEPGRRVPRHTHKHARLVLVLSGSVTEILGDETATHGPSSLLFRRAEAPHAYAIGPSGATCLVVDIEPAWLGRVRDEAPVLAGSGAFRGGLVVHLAHRLHGEFRLRDEVSRLAIQSLALGVLAEASRRIAHLRASRFGGQAPLWLRQARALVDLHFVRPLPLTTVAERGGVHPVHLPRTVPRCFQTTFAGYVRQLRTEFAIAELRGAARSVR